MSIEPAPSEPEVDALAGAERDLRNARFKQCDRRSVELVMAEYDRRGERIAALEAVVAAARRVERPMGDWQPGWDALWEALAALSPEVDPDA